MDVRMPVLDGVESTRQLSAQADPPKILLLTTFEIDAYADWKLNQNFTLSLLGAYAEPGKAVQQATGRTKHFVYGMAYLGYSF